MLITLAHFLEKKTRAEEMKIPCFRFENGTTVSLSLTNCGLSPVKISAASRWAAGSLRLVKVFDLSTFMSPLRDLKHLELHNQTALSVTVGISYLPLWGSVIVKFKNVFESLLRVTCFVSFRQYPPSSTHSSIG